MCQSIAEVVEHIHYWDVERHNLPYDTDGMVIKVNDFEDQESLGTTAKDPNGRRPSSIHQKKWKRL